MEGEDVQMHHTAVQLRQMMPQADFRIALGHMMADMEAAAKEGQPDIEFNDGDYGVADMARYWRHGTETTRTGRIVAELKRLGFATDLTGPIDNLSLRVSW